ncbi:hypothetical protein [Halovenus halobia]|uniref:hypothetical protein n=1 Tax=Halovenus halobia TaxID=3396622 RepID=UPI003F55CF75
MSRGRTLAVVVLSILLTVTLFGASLSVGAERTALDQQYVVTQFEQEGVSEQIGAQIRGDITTQIDQAGEQRPVPTGITVNLDGGQVANQSVTDEYLADELSRNVGAIIEYLRGNRADLALTTNLTPVKAEVRVALIDGIAVDTPQLVGSNTDRVNAERVAALDESEQSYQDAQIELSDQERAEIEKEINQSIGQQLSNDSEELAAALLDHQRTVLDGLTGELSYEEYVDQLAADERALKVAIADAALAEIPDEESLVDGTESAESNIEPIRSGAERIVLFSWFLPLLAVVLVAGLYLVTRSPERTATATSIALAIAGLLGAVGGYIVGPTVTAATEPSGGQADPIVAGLTAVVDGSLATIGRQSVLLLVAGVVVFVVVVADRRGVFDGLRTRLGQETRGR